MTTPPPSRYKVVEDGRRLVVIDTWEGGGRPASVTPSHPPAASLAGTAPKNLGPGQRRERVPGRPEKRPDDRHRGRPLLAGEQALTLRTTRFFDDNGPRTIHLRPGSRALGKVTPTLAGVVIVLLGLSVLISPAVLILVAALAYQSRGKLRALITAWLDEAARGG